MKASELRIGNLIKCISTGEIEVVKDIKTAKRKKGNVNDVSIDDCVGIELTEERLIKFCFEKDNEIEFHIHSNNNHIIYIYFEKLRNCYAMVYNGVQYCVVQYVHQLQNLYFALTGEELEITQKVTNMDLLIKRKSDGEVFKVWKYVLGSTSQPEEHIWCNDWYGHHIIGVDCEWAESNVIEPDWIDIKDQDKPRDGTRIQMWHKVWKCPITVFYNKDKAYEKTPWIEVSLGTSWPESSFTDHWKPISTKPKSDGKTTITETT